MKKGLFFLDKILIVDDEFKIAEVIEAYLKREGFLTAIATNGKEALNIVNNEKISLIILDLMLPDISGEEICKKVKDIYNIPVIMLTAKSSEESVLCGFSLGADDYVTKPFSEKELVARAKAILKRVYKEDKKILEFKNLYINLDNFEVIFMGKKVQLTPSEFKILWHLANNPSKVFTRGELLNIAINDEGEVFDRIIDAHIKNIRAKIKCAKYIITVHGVGYKFNEEP